MRPIRSRIIPFDQSRFHILFALAATQPCHGAGIRAQIIGDTVGELYIKDSSLYVLLRDLEQRGFIEAQPGYVARYARPYRLTKKGLQKLDQEIKRLKVVLSLARERM